MHGGADGSGAPKGPKNGNYKHGRYTEEVSLKTKRTRSSIGPVICFMVVTPICHTPEQRAIRALAPRTFPTPHAYPWHSDV
jgi:hypothetical protein